MLDSLIVPVFPGMLLGLDDCRAVARCFSLHVLELESISRRILQLVY
jgi:hypothetical protein